LLADALLVVHFPVAGFIVGGLILVWIGAPSIDRFDVGRHNGLLNSCARQL
jgi:hypothetical protein